MTAIRWVILFLSAFVLLSACQEVGDRCISACRSKVDCDSLGQTMSSSEKRVRVQTCTDQCVNDRWSEDLTTCLANSKGYCVPVNLCTPSEPTPSDSGAE